MNRIKALMSCTLVPWLLVGVFASLAYFLLMRDIKLTVDIPENGGDSLIHTIVIFPDSTDRVLNLEDFAGTVEISRQVDRGSFQFTERLISTYKNGESGLRQEFKPSKSLIMLRICGTDLKGVGKVPTLVSK